MDASGRIRFLDAYWREWQLHAEVDGAHHMDQGRPNPKIPGILDPPPPEARQLHQALTAARTVSYQDSATSSPRQA